MLPMASKGEQALKAVESETERDVGINQRSSKRLKTQSEVTALIFCAWDPDVVWYCLDLGTNRIFPLPLAKMPPKARKSPSIISYQNSIFVLGGGRFNNDSTCPDKRTTFASFHFHDYVFGFDCSKNEWVDASPMRIGRMQPATAVIQGKIYVFGGHAAADFNEVFDISRNAWNKLYHPEDLSWPSYPVLVHNSRVLVHFASKNSLRAYDVNLQEWESVEEDFGEWPELAVIVDDLLYCLFDDNYSCYNFSPENCPLKPYDLAGNKWLNAKWVSPSTISAPKASQLLHLGGGKLCLVSSSAYPQQSINCITVNVCETEEGIVATEDPKSVTSVDFDKFHLSEFLPLDDQLEEFKAHLVKLGLLC